MDKKLNFYVNEQGLPVYQVTDYSDDYKKDFIAKVKTKYPYLSDEDVSFIVSKAMMFYFALKYPCEPEVNEVNRPITSFVGQTWVLSACDELIEKLGFNSVIGYRENGVSWTFDNAEISDRLVNMITPIIGVIK